MGPTISVVLPFLGTVEEARQAIAALTGLDARPGDELIFADNTPEGIVAPIAPDQISVVNASEQRSASHARNVGAGVAKGDWLLFVDADCEFPSDLLDRYRSQALAENVGVVAGEITGSSSQPGLLPRWARSRRDLWVSHHQTGGPAPAGITANMLVRRSAWTDVGGFQIGGGGDLDLSWRLQAAGWKLIYRPDIVVVHQDRESLRDLVSQAFSYGSHQHRLRRLHGSQVGRSKLLRPLARSLGGAVIWAFRGRLEAALFKVIDGLWASVFWLGDVTGGPGARRAD